MYHIRLYENCRLLKIRLLKLFLFFLWTLWNTFLGSFSQGDYLFRRSKHWWYGRFLLFSPRENDPRKEKIRETKFSKEWKTFSCISNGETERTLLRNRNSLFLSLFCLVWGRGRYTPSSLHSKSQEANYQFWVQSRTRTI